MLHEFVTTHRDAIIARTREKVKNRPWPAVSTSELDHGVPVFLTQLSETLRWETTATPFAPDAIGASAARHGGALLALGFNVSQVVHDYGDICQAVTEVALEHHAEITTEEFHTLNRCLDNAIAEAVTEHARITAASKATEEVERLGQLTHEIRDKLNTAFFAFHALKAGAVAINGSTGAVLGRSLMGLRALVDSTLCDIRLAATQHRRERVNVASLLNDVGVAGSLDAEYRGLRFTIEPVGSELNVEADPHLLASAVTNLLNNALKYTRAGGHVVLRASEEARRLHIEVADECGGIPEGKGDPFQVFADQRGSDRSGLGLGLSIARKAVRAHGGDIHIRNTPGKGCVFMIDVPLATERASAQVPVEKPAVTRH
jgi:signal transduction histidine kinase